MTFTGYTVTYSEVQDVIYVLLLGCIIIKLRLYTLRFYEMEKMLFYWLKIVNFIPFTSISVSFLPNHINVEMVVDGPNVNAIKGYYIN